jgi:hypothetical protein
MLFIWNFLAQSQYVLSNFIFLSNRFSFSCSFSFRSKSLFFIKLNNELFYNDKTIVVFGDARNVIEDMVKALTSIKVTVEAGELFAQI